MVKRGRKKGSTLITVLAVSVVFMSLTAVILKSVSSTSKAHNNQKETEDLRYIAESGLEVARSYLNGKTTITQDDITKINNLNNSLFTNTEIESVNIVSPTIDSNGHITNTKSQGNASGTVSGFKLRIQAKQRGRNKAEEIGADYIASAGNNGSIFDYGIVTGSGGLNVESTGTVDMGATNIAGPQGAISLPSHTQTVPPASQADKNFGDINFMNMELVDEIVIGKLDEKGEIEGVKYEDLATNSDKHQIKGFKYYDAGTKKQLEVTTLKLNLSNNKVYINDVEKTLNDIKTLSKKAIVDIVVTNEQFENGSTADGRTEKMKLTNINSRKTNMNLEGNPLDLTYHSIINKGELNVTGKGTMTIKYGTVFAKKMYVSKDSAIHVTYQAAQMPDLVGHGVLSNEEEKKLNELMNVMIPNWGVETGFGGASLDFKENSFSN